jgi:hypothetical protein
VFGGAGGVQRDQQPTTITLTVLTEAVNFEFGKFYLRIDQKPFGCNTNCH